MKPFPRAVISLFIVLTLASCSAYQLTPSEIHPGSYKRKIDLKARGFKRSYRYYIPGRYTVDQAWPVVVVLHGAFSSGREMEKISDFDALAERDGFVVMYPNGIGLLGFLRHWNAGYCCGRAMKDGVDDVNFILTAIDDLSTFVTVDPARIFLVGYSNGGMLAYHIAATETERFRGLAVVAGSIGSRAASDQQVKRIRPAQSPLPVLVIHGIDDQSVPFRGGGYKKNPNGPYFESADESIRFWINNNRCEFVPESHSINAGISVQTWASLENQTSVVLCSLSDWGHEWPGRSVTARLPADHPIHGFDAAELIWRFFEGLSEQAENTKAIGE